MDTENIVFGRNPVLEALRGNRTVEKIYILKGSREGSAIKILAVAKDKKIPIIEVDRQKLEKICSSSSHQGIAAAVNDFVYSSPREILNFAEQKGEKPFILILDGVTDPHNLGAIIRTANACGVHGIILPKRNSCALPATVFKSAAGACEFMKISRVSNIAETIRTLKKENVWIYAADGENETSTNIYETDMTGSAAVVLGDEGKGVSQGVLKECDFKIKIPMKGEISSLNVSVASGVILYEILRQRG